MQTNIFYKVNVSTKIVILMLISISLLIANSIYYIGFTTIFFLILFVLTNENVKQYIETIKNVKFWLLFILIAYIIVMGNIFYSIIFAYKILLIVFYFKHFELNVNFEQLGNGVKTLLFPLHKVINVDKISYNICLVIYFFKYYIESKDIIFANYNSYERYLHVYSLKFNIFPRFLNTTKNTKKLENALALKNYMPIVEMKNFSSKVALIISCIIFIIVILKDVIL